MPSGIISGQNGATLQRQQDSKEQREKDYQAQRKKWRLERYFEELDRQRYAREAGRFPHDK